jgi:hypothetical protein
MPVMSGFRVRLGTQPVNSRYSPTAFARADMLTATASGANSYWIGDHLNKLFPRSIAIPRYLGAAKLVPKIEATLEPWTMLGHLASRNRFARLRLGVGLTDASRRNPAVTERLRRLRRVENLKFEPIDFVPGAAASAVGSVLCSSREAFEGGFAGAALGCVLAPGLPAVGAALVVAV